MRRHRCQREGCGNTFLPLKNFRLCTPCLLELAAWKPEGGSWTGAGE